MKNKFIEVKITKDQVIRSRVTEAFKNKIKKYSEKNNMTMSEVIEMALIGYIGE
jgi:antitoxin component of RelBE/YafQ-DinJ toxin-antitoxin module